MVDRRARLQPVADRAEQALRQLLRAVHGDLPGAVADRRVLEAGEQGRGIVGERRRPAGRERSG